MLKPPRMCGWPLSPRRLPALLVLLSLLAVLLIGSLTWAVPASPGLSAYGHSISTSIAHASDAPPTELDKPPSSPQASPARQKIEEHDGSSWVADERWLSTSYSNSITLDNERVLLPPLKARPPIYCYHDSSVKKTKDERDAENELLLTWRRAWWAQGFRPVVLGAVDARNNPSYERFQTTTASSELKVDLMRWLAWDTVNGGILSEYTVLPAVPRRDPLLLFLRQGEYANLTKWADLDDAFLVGQQNNVRSAIYSVLQKEDFHDATSVTTVLSSDSITVNHTSTPLAYYSPKVIETKYANVIRKGSTADTLRNLNKLINYHLLVAWQNNFLEGIDVVKPHPEHATAMVAGALKLAKSLAACPASPMPSTCPPNLPKCFPCVASPMTVSTPSRFRNSPQIFSIGVVPHPWSFALVDNLRESINATWILESPRDPWLSAVTMAYLGTGVSSNRRVMRFKELAAGQVATSDSLWLPAENEVPSDLDWYFGFTLPEKSMNDGKSQSPVPADRLPKPELELPDRLNGPVASDEDVAQERALLDRAKSVVMVNKSSTNGTKMRTSLEAWNMADTEAWRFTRALNARRLLERDEWANEVPSKSGIQNSLSGHS
ncbi:hypothetical protein BBK36DRAFT_1166225 [Trichoderma citrinoviride]|uniref:Uncharacterized protein n=1 Tax=Trichoderma citrinoviride TaxID=58853 RepID=A0A2T4BL22_9HYPO|nr:hypothetical protein BBK36DRAFT_1166225 [Trichoderma citrinoviride]PTB70024.1 hypothetical protein BBK36DRAFT_1166225 [Trichoderma citrinoviride]